VSCDGVEVDGRGWETCVDDDGRVWIVQNGYF
jgi:hypothetical protein